MQFRLMMMFLCLLLANQLMAQKKYVVYAIKGNPTYTKNQQQNKLTTGIFLQSGESITLQKSDAVYLIGETDYCLLQLNKPGVYNMQLLQQRCVRQPQHVTYNYFRYVWESFSHPHEKPEQNRKAFMTNYGAAIRGCEYIQPENFEDTIRYCGKSALLKWRNTEPYNTSYITVYDKAKGGKVVLDTSITGSAIDLKNICATFKKGTTYYFSIAAEKQSSCSRYVLEYKSDASVTAFKNNVNKACKQNGFSGVALQEAIAFIAEENKYYGIQ